MSNSKPDTQAEKPPCPSWVLKIVIGISSLVLLVIVISGLMFQVKPEDDFEYTQAQLLEKTLGVAHDELIMLIISLFVLIQITANFKQIRRVPHHLLIVCSFLAFGLSAFFTVTESLIFPEVLNYLEHICFLVSSVLLASWVWCVFSFGRREGV